MIRTSVRLSVCLLLICCTLPLMAQRAASADSVVPAMVKFTGTLNDINGKPLTGTVGVTFLLYKEQTGGAPLWMETQNVQADNKGHYSAMLGSASSHGLPRELFVDGEARWLAVLPAGQEEQPRTALMSVPYALKAADAQTLGGRPASSFMLAPAEGAKGQQGPLAEQPNEIVCSSSAACKTGFIPAFSSNGGSAKVASSVLFQIANKIGVGTTAPTALVDVNGSAVVRGNLTASGDVSTSGNAAQNRTNGGWVKAMVYASGFGSGALYYCYNSTLSGPAATTPPCGFSIVKPFPFNNGDYIIDFGFQVEDRLFSLTPSYYTYPGKVCTFTNGGNCPSMASLGVNQAEVTFTDLAGNLADNKFYIVVY